MAEAGRGNHIEPGQVGRPVEGRQLEGPPQKLVVVRKHTGDSLVPEPGLQWHNPEEFDNIVHRRGCRIDPRTEAGHIQAGQ